MATITSTRFKGYVAQFKTVGDALCKCFVVNSSDRMKFKDGTEGPAFKVAPAHLYTAGGWSMGSERTAERWLAPIWLKAERVTPKADSETVR